MDGIAARVSSTYLSWRDIENCVDALADKILKIGGIKHIVGVTRGGMIPAVMLSHRLGLRKVYTVHASSYDENNRQQDLELFFDGKTQMIINRFDTVVVDDVIDTGKTFETMRIMAPKPYYMACVTKLPEYIESAGQIVDPSLWIHFPWEVTR